MRMLDSPQGAVVRTGELELRNFSSNDYLGLADSPEVKEALIRGVERWGAGAWASRLICGTHSPHHALEEARRPRALQVGESESVGVLLELLGDGVIPHERL